MYTKDPSPHPPGTERYYLSHPLPPSGLNLLINLDIAYTSDLSTGPYKDKMYSFFDNFDVIYCLKLTIFE